MGKNSETSFGLAVALSVLSAVLLSASMPGYDVPLIGWVALVPLLFALFTVNKRRI